jgi:hypothetical protein
MGDPSINKEFIITIRYLRKPKEIYIYMLLLWTYLVFGGVPGVAHEKEESIEYTSNYHFENISFRI